MTVLDLFQPAVSDWFRTTLGQPTPAQALGWPAIARGDSTLLLAPTGSGKTLAAFLVAIDRLMRAAPSDTCDGTRVLYVSPLKALAVDVERNLRAPLAGIADVASRAGRHVTQPRIDVRTGDTPPAQRARMARAPADILITTPESLYLLLTSAARETLACVDTLIVDEIHALVAGKRGAHLALSLERLEALRPREATRLQRIGLSATQRPLDEVARLLGGFENGCARPVTVVDAGARKQLDLVVERGAGREHRKGERLADDDSRGNDATRSWPVVHSRVVELVRAHRSTIVFVNSRRLAERLAAAVNDTAHEELALAHHGSLARERRAAIEDRLKRGEVRAIVATSSLELGIDMGSVDLVVQIESPPGVTSALQRIGRACHGVGGVPRGVMIARHRHDLVSCAAATASMRAGEVEETFYPRNPLDVLAQQIVAMLSVEPLAASELLERVRRAAPFADLPQSAFESVLDMLSGRYPSDDFAELRPRITWDRSRGRLEARAGSHRLAVTNGGTIPDRGLYGVFTAANDGHRRVGELDEEMVFELREGEVFLLGASSWRAEQITPDRVIVSPAAGEPGKMPFWHGDRAGRSRQFGMRVGALVRRLATGELDANALCNAHCLEPAAAEVLAAYVREQVAATGEVPSDRTVVIERFLDEVGDWRVVVMCPFGTRVLAPWAMAVSALLRKRYTDVDHHVTDDGIAFRIPACEEPPPPELFVPSPDAVESMVMHALDGTSLFAVRFRECAGRALLLPRRDPRRRTPLWAQRRRAGDLLAVAARHPDFPIVLETYRECLRDAFDLPGLVAVLSDIASRRVRLTTVDRRHPSPFAASVLFAFVAAFIYDTDAPLTERRAHALSIDFARLGELLGDAELRGLLSARVIDEYVAWLQRVARPVDNVDRVHDLLLAVGDLSAEEVSDRSSPREQGQRWLRELVRAGRAIEVSIAGEKRVAAVEDAAKYRDALGIVLPKGLPEALLEPTDQPLRNLVMRYGRTHGPFVVRDIATRFGIDVSLVEPEIASLLREGRLVEGAFLPEGTQRELCDKGVLDAVRRKSLAALRREIEPVDVRTLARFLPEWQGTLRKRRGRDGLLSVIAELQGCPLVFSSLESQVLPARIEGYRSWDLDALCASGEVSWAGIEPLGANDGRIALYLAKDEALLARAPTPVQGSLAATIRRSLAQRGAMFFADLAAQARTFPNDILETLWQMVWAGEVTNDTLEPLRSRAPTARLRLLARGHASFRGRAVRSEVELPSRQNEFDDQRARALHRHGGRAVRTGTPGSEGRWSLRASRWDARTDTDRRAALARLLLDRYGIVTRETAHAEGIDGGFTAVYDVLKALEEQGRVHRGYFVEGRGGAQFALAGAEERLRALPRASDSDRALVLAATDPANAWGALIDWPPSSVASRPQRAAGALVVLRDGSLLGWLGRSDNLLITFLPDGEPARGAAARALAHALGDMVEQGTRRALLVATIDGVPAAASSLVAAFADAGFAATADGLFKRSAPTRIATDAPGDEKAAAEW